MIQTTYKKGPISINHVWYMDSSDQLNELKKADAYFLHGVNDIAPKGITSKGIQNTLISDLLISEEEAWSKVSRTFRNHINRCIKEDRKYEIICAKDVENRTDIVEKFISSYNQMYSSKGMETIFNKAQFDAYVKEQAVCLCVAYREEEPVVFHAYIIDDKNVRLWYSCSNFRDDKEGAAEIGRLNKFLHWREMLDFKAQGIEKYDWGGVNFDDPKVKGISDFKVQFGGENVSYENVIFTNNWILKILLRFVVKL